jgi:hypothetical protein
MSETDTRTTKVLFREWRAGDSQAGQIMAQRFADWYYAIATSRLGESGGAGACEQACAQFGEGVVNITESRELVPWAHGVITQLLSASGSRVGDGDEPNAYTTNQPPKALLVKARAALPEEVGLLEVAYRQGSTSAEIDALAGPLGGNPLGILKARYRVKAWMKANLSVPFDVTPDNPVLDRAPLPLYESGKMGSPDEEVSFEHWMISDIDLCRDIAEFAHFAIALRGGIPSEAAAQAAASQRTAHHEIVDSAQLEQNPGCLGKIMAMFGS